MLIVFEVIIARGEDSNTFLSDDVLEETKAQIMTIDEARAVGFTRAEPRMDGLEVRMVAVAERDARFIQSRLEGSSMVQSFRAHEIP
jgi:hypothetical protein